MNTCTRPRKARTSANTRSRFRLRQDIQYLPTCSSIRSRRRKTAGRIRSRRAATISRDVPLVQTAIRSMFNLPKSQPVFVE